MARLNVPTSSVPIFTHEGAKAQMINPELQLRRSVCACMLWEDTFYENGESVADRIIQTIPNVSAMKVASLAVEAREKFKLRHVPLLMVREMARLTQYKSLVAETLGRVIQRPDELTEFLAIYWKGEKTRKKSPLSAQVKKGLAAAFQKFNEYQLAKYDRDGAIKLRDVLFLCHAKPKDDEQEALWKRLVNKTLVIPDTWEVEISKNKSNKDSWERLLCENKLGGLALLRNLRNMSEAGVDPELIHSAFLKMKVERILPFRFIAAAKYAPQWESWIEEAMLKCTAGMEKLPGKTVIVVDGSGSMFGTKVSARSEIDRFEAAAALAILARELCETCEVLVFSNDTFLVPARRGFALQDALYKGAQQGGTNTQHAVAAAAGLGYDRVIIITDEQSRQVIQPPVPGSKGYVVNVATYQNGIGYGAWTHIDGWSEAILSYIQESEKV